MDYAKKKHSTAKGCITKVGLATLTIFLPSLCSVAQVLTWSSPKPSLGLPDIEIMDWRPVVSIAMDLNNNWHVVYDNCEEGPFGIRTYYINYVSNTGTQGIA